jgi:hypothetical protein
VLFAKGISQAKNGDELFQEEKFHAATKKNKLNLGGASSN